MRICVAADDYPGDPPVTGASRKSRASSRIPTDEPLEQPTAEELAADLTRMGAVEGAKALEHVGDTVAVQALQIVNPAIAGDIIEQLDEEHREDVFAKGPHAVTQQWSTNLAYPDDSLGRLMEAPVAVFSVDQTVGQVINQVRQLVKQLLVTYCYVTDGEQRLIGLVTMRDLLVNEDTARIGDIMLRDLFYLRPETKLTDAMKQVLNRHYPVYPVCDHSGRLVGLVRGHSMFEEQAYEISAQPGRMVGVDKEERLATPWPRSLKFRHPWLQLNLLTAFVAAAVVGLFQQTLDQMVILALFLPVLAGQSGNTGCQALAVTLRGLTLGELQPGTEKALVAKEGLLGLMNGALVGITAGLGMYVAARGASNPNAVMLALIVALAMIGSCVVSGISGALIPLTLRRFGADPATASSIFLTTATDVASMGLFLGLATIFLM
jgi:magnesium transporter